MKMLIKAKLMATLALCILALQVRSQLPTGTWRDHLPYSHGRKLAEFDNRMFCSTQDGSLFSYSLKDRSIKKHSKVNGLSDADITTIGASETTGTFLVGYHNGNIDLIRNDTVINIPDIKRKMIMGGKSVNNVYFIDHYAYLACAFGIVVCDLNKREIKDTYYFGPNGSQVYVNDITSDGTFLVAATDQGIFKARIDDPNLLDFNAWSRILQLPDPDADYPYIISYNQKLFTIHRNTVSGTDEVISFNDTGWESWAQNYDSRYAQLGEQNGFLILSSFGRTKVFSPAETIERDVVTYYAQYVLIDSRGIFWYAAQYGGLAMIDTEGNGSTVVPEGPAYREAGDIEILNGNVWVGAGTIKTQWTGYGAYSLIDGKWRELNGNTIPEMKDFLNISEISIDPLDPGHVIGGSFGYGIAEFQDGTLVAIEDETGGILRPVTGFENEPGFVRITGTDFNTEGTIYAAGSYSETAAYKKEKGGNWQAFELDYDGFGFNVATGEILANSQGQLWLLIVNKGILVFEEENGEVVREKFFTVRNQEGHSFDYVLSAAEDKDGTIWIGTNRGPVIYSNISEIFETERVTGYQPVIPRNDGTTFGSLLLSSEQINDIVVDGANRKWVATEKSGVFLVSSDGKKELLHFTEENSPLFSNSVQTIGVNDKTGEVFFGTERGIIGYRSGATEGGDDFGDVYVFPNPVRETFEGDITVTGLASNVNVKITDIAGNLVYETKALGGQALWNGRNFRGDRVQTGVYLVFCTSEDGSKTFVTKLLFIH